MAECRVGDWVTQYSAGFWQIVELKPKYADEDSGKHKKGDLIGQWALLKKGFTPKMKLRLDCEVVDFSWCKPVSEEQKQRIIQFFADHPQDLKRFTDSPYFDRPAIATAWLQLSAEEAMRFQKAITSLPDRFSRKALEAILKAADLSSIISKPPTNYVFQCKQTLWEINADFEPLFHDPILSPYENKDQTP